MTGDDPLACARARLAQVFRYLQALHRVRTPPVVQLAEREWVLRLDALPDTPHVQRGFHLDGAGRFAPESEADPAGFVLKVARPGETECPEPSVVLKNWLKPEYRDARAAPEALVRNTLKVRGGGRQAFADSEQRVEAFEKWCQERAAWAAAALQAADGFALFTNLFDLYARFERESEKYQLFVADGILAMEHESGQVCHPVLLQRVELRFDPAIPEFCIVDSADTPEVYTPLLRHVGLDGRAIQHVTDAVAAGHFHPLAGESTSAFLRDLVQRCWTDGQFFEDLHEAAAAANGGPCITRVPHLILGNRSYGLADNIERYLAALEQSTELPESLLRIVGIESRRSAGEGPTDLLLTKPANPEQEEVIRRLEETGAVLVQGPPGTGKSHTIANLIGHLLAQNKSILVTSHASKALRVVREKLAPALQPLCVSVLQSDDESARQLEESITGIVNTLASTSAKKLEKELGKLTEQRTELFEQRQALQQALFAAVQDEYREVEVLGERLTPADAARRLVEWRGTHDWIPGPVLAGAELPLDAQEVAELYALIAGFAPEFEAMARVELPAVETFANPKDFAALLDELAALEKARIETHSEWWTHDQQDAAQLPELLQRLQQSVALLHDEEGWVRDCLEAGRRGGKQRAAWLELVQQIEACAEEIPGRESLVLEHAPEIDSTRSLEELAQSCRAIAEHLEAGGSLGRFNTWRHRDWRELLQCARVDGVPPATAAHFRALTCELEIRELREDLTRRWDQQMAPLGAPSAAELGQRPEVKALGYASRIREALAWPEEVWAGWEALLEQLGLDWRRLLQKTGVARKGEPEPEAIRALVEEHLAPVFAARERQLRLLELRAERERWLASLASVPQKGPLKGLLQRFRAGIKKGDFDAYADAYQELSSLHEARDKLERMDELFARLEGAAPAWVAALREREAHHADGRVPGDVAAAWRCRQWSDRLAEQDQVDLDRLQEELDQSSEALFERTARFVEKSSWLAQLLRTGLEQQQALAGWLQLQKKMGKGGGKHVPRLKEEAKLALARCRSAVPVWIMPLSRVVESFDLASTRFDVVILDEASQCDVMGLLAFALGREVVVVGDHEQVSPYAVGLSTDQIRALIDELLTDVPNRQLYDGKTSVYDLAQQSFGGTIRLLEHFRSVPDIIRFSNELCYGGEIRPLREASSARVAPALVAHRVPNGVEKNGINENEAQEIAALVAAVCRLEEYDDCSLGVISMVGTDQALYIDSILRSRLSTTEYRRRQILCGNASQFQGDERDVIFLSMVNSSGEDPLALRLRDDARKVVNVAASRARDQLWVVHSLDPTRDLKPGDLRLQLISHAEGAKREPAKGPEREPRFSSEVERELCQRLEAEGYRVLRHHPVGDGVIELVVEGVGGRRVAVQCDGDRILAGDEVEAQLVRQLSLRRLGWEFLRVRASEVVRGGERAFERLCERLGERGVEPLTEGDEAAGTAAAAKTPAADALPVKVIHRAEMIRSRWQVPSPADLRGARKSDEEEPEPDVEGDDDVDDDMDGEMEGEMEGEVEGEE